jgi:hypothetical protein
VIFAGTTRSIPEILEAHFEALEYLWDRRCSGLRSAEIYAREFAELGDRIAAHTDALVLAGPDAVPVLKKGLTADEMAVVLTSGHTLLGMDESEAASHVVAALPGAPATGLAGLCLALSYGSLERVADELREIAASGPVAPAAVAAEALAFHGHGDAARARIAGLLACEQAAVRRSGWRMVALLHGTSGAAESGLAGSPAAYERALRDEDAGVREQALETAAWTRQPWLLDHCRKAAREPSAGNAPLLLMLAILGEPSELELVLAAGRASALGAARFKVLGAFGHPGAADLLLAGTADPSPAIAAAAGAAYTRLTGADVGSDRRAKSPPPGGGALDEFEQEFVEEVLLPDPDLARAHWTATRENFLRGTRWCRGFDMSREPESGALDALDQASRWEARLRGRFRGAWSGGLAEFERIGLPASAGEASRRG